MKHSKIYKLTGLIVAISCLMGWNAHATAQDKVVKPASVAQKKLRQKKHSAIVEAAQRWWSSLREAF